MNDERRTTNDERRTEAARSVRSPFVVGSSCVTCSDEALPARVLRVDQETGLAHVAIQDSTTEVDVSLVDRVIPGDLLLVHGGVALERLKEPSDG